MHAFTHPAIPGVRTRLKGVTRSHPCVICGGDHKCSRGDDGLIVCGRPPGEVLGFRYLGRCQGDEQFGLYREETVTVPSRTPSPARSSMTGTRDWNRMLGDAVACFDEERRAELGRQLGLPPAVFYALPVGWAPADSRGPCWLFPERDHRELVIGVVRRYLDGAKIAMPGSRRGLTVPAQWASRDGPVLCPEGASDALALTAMHLAAVGRPSNAGGTDELARLLASVPTSRPIVILGENDQKSTGEWPGRDGARRLAARLTSLLHRSVAWALPSDGIKDVRGWVCRRAPDPTMADAWHDLGEDFLRELAGWTREAPVFEPALAAVPAEAVAVSWEPPVPLGELGAVEPFPVDALPGAARLFVGQVAAAVGCPPDFVGLAVLAVAGAAVGASRVLGIKPGWTESACLYAALVGRPGSGKSPALKLAAQPVYDLEAALQRQFAPRSPAPEDLRSHLERLVRENTAGLFDPQRASATPFPMTPPVTRFLVADATVESLAPVLRDNPRGLVLIRDELTALVGGLNQYKSGRGSDKQFYLAVWAGEPACIDRRTHADGPLLVPRPFLTVVGGLPPDLLPNLRGRRGASDGFLDRFLFAYPDAPLAADWSWEGVAEETVTAWAGLIGRLRKLEPEPDGQGGFRPWPLRFDPEARRLWQAYLEEWTAEVSGPEFPDYLRDPWAKLKAYAGRLALIVHCLRLVQGETDREELDSVSLNAGLRLVRYFAGHTRKVWSAVDADPKVVRAREVVEWLRQHPEVETFTRHLLHSRLRFRHHFASAPALDGPLDLLERHGFVRARRAVYAGVGRRPGDLYDVNPLWPRASGGG